MTRDEAIEAGARALWDGTREELRAPYEWDAVAEVRKPVWRSRAAAVLDAIGWAEPVGYVVAHEDRDPPGMLYPAPWPDLESARAWAERGERVWGIVPVEGTIEPDANEGGE